MPVNEEEIAIPGVTQFDKPLFNPDVLRDLCRNGRHLAMFRIKRKGWYHISYFWIGDHVGSTYDALFGSGSQLVLPEAKIASFVNHDQYLDVKEAIPPPFSETTLSRDANGNILWQYALK